MSSVEIIISVIGGLGLFIYGMKLMGDGLENAAGEGLKSILEKVTSNRIVAVLVGTVVTAVIQSSSATTVMVVGFVNAGLMNLVQAAGIIMGANIGTTITAQLVAFKLDAIAPVFVGIGTAIVMFAKGKKRREIGNIILGFGILFMGMGIMSSALKPLSNSPVFGDFVIAIGDRWYIGILAGLIMTGIIQSSSATTGILIALATTGAIDIKLAIPVLFGCNIGTCVTALLACIGTNKTARKAALIHLIFNTFGTLIFIPFISILGDIVGGLTPGDIKRQIANAHTIFNITNTLIMLPLTGLLISIVNKIIPGEDEVEKAAPKYLDDRLLETPVIAAGQVAKETLRMATKAKNNLEISMDALLKGDEKLISKVMENEHIINILEEAITSYLVKLSKLDLSDKEKNLVAATFHVINDIERIGDHAENIADLASQKIHKNLKYTDEAIEELQNIYNYTLLALEIAIESYSSRDVEKASTIMEYESKIDSYEKEYRDNHIKRLNRGQCNAYSSAFFLEVLSNFERIGDHATNIAESVIESNS